MNGIVQRLAGNTLHIPVSQSYTSTAPSTTRHAALFTVCKDMHACARLTQAHVLLRQARHLDVQPAAQRQAAPAPLTGGAELGEEQQAVKHQADTLFLGTCYDGEAERTAGRGRQRVLCRLRRLAPPALCAWPARRA
jgi:hypothetical protein